MNRILARVFCSIFVVPVICLAQTDPSQYHIYAGNTHSHTIYTLSHGEMYVKNDCTGIAVFGPDPHTSFLDEWSQGYVQVKSACPSIIIIGSAQYPGPNDALKPDWQKYQGPPSAHYALAKADGYDFYVTTDHSQEAAFQPAQPR